MSSYSPGFSNWLLISGLLLSDCKMLPPLEASYFSGNSIQSIIGLPLYAIFFFFPFIKEEPPKRLLLGSHWPDSASQPATWGCQDWLREPTMPWDWVYCYLSGSMLLLERESKEGLLYRQPTEFSRVIIGFTWEKKRTTVKFG